MPSHILVTGAPGNVGTPVVRALQDTGVPVRVGAFDVALAHQQVGDDAEVVYFNFLDPATYQPTFSGIERMFLVRPPALANVQAQIAPALRAAVDAGVRHIVFLSIQGVEKNRMVPHHKIEQLILELAVTYTFLRAGFFMQNLSTTHRQEIAERGEIAVPVGKARTSFIDTRDIGAVAAAALAETGHENRVYTLTGREALDYYQVAAIMSELLDRPISYTNPSPVRFFLRQIAGGSKPGYALVVTALYTITRFGHAETVTHDVAAVLGRTPIPFRQFVADYRAVWQA